MFWPQKKLVSSEKPWFILVVWCVHRFIEDARQLRQRPSKLLSVSWVHRAGHQRINQRPEPGLRPNVVSGTGLWSRLRAKKPEVKQWMCVALIYRLFSSRHFSNAWWTSAKTGPRTETGLRSWLMFSDAWLWLKSCFVIGRSVSARRLMVGDEMWRSRQSSVKRAESTFLEDFQWSDWFNDSRGISEVVTSGGEISV